MGTLHHDYGQFPLSLMRHGFKTWRLRTKLLVALIPSVVVILILTGYITLWFSSKFLDEAVKESLQIKTVALARDFEILLGQCKENLLDVAQRPITRSRFHSLLKSRRNISGVPYSELGFISQNGQDHVYVAAVGDDICSVRAEHVAMISPSPLTLAYHVSQLKNGEVWISDVIDVVYPFGLGDRDANKEPAKIIRFVTPYYDENGSKAGVLLLSVDARQLLKILSQISSPQSPLFARTGGSPPIYGYLFDKEGSILFHSEETPGNLKKLPADPGAPQIEEAMVEKPGFGFRFRPSSLDKDYWHIVKDVRSGRHGSVRMIDLGEYRNPSSTLHFHGYAPIHFNIAPDRKPIVFGGVVLVDRSNLTIWAGYKQIDVMFLVTVLTIIVISILIVGLSRIITRPILDLAAAVNHIQQTGKLQEITLSKYDDETSGLQRAINRMVLTLKKQMEEIRLKDEMIKKESEREKARLEEEVNALRRRLEPHDIEEIIGFGQTIDALKGNILRAASVDADVLIVGETGTGKQLTAEAIHKHSALAEKPFISINCGALDENLLLDSLFGHVKGAFTEARVDRKGAFLAANGGTLFLDEIGAASLRVQQSLLRAISMRKIKPLGSDEETEVNTRLITATNVDLRKLIRKGIFREDLYYRLEVLTIRTPSLRDHKENIPVLVEDFLNQAGRLMNRKDIGITKGALEKMKNYHWPGNVRELMNCVTRAVAMAEGELIHVDDIRLGGVEEFRFPGKNVVGYHSQPVRPEPPTQNSEVFPPDLNVRQKKAFPFIVRKGEITRSEYQAAVGNNLPSRTALYDLRDFVERGLLKKTGRGPATRYYLANLPDSAK
ncbi:MAG: sigma 54-interacting transcriptional regulator [Deltaproteobacteria bacterium]|nr:sigma 54-interacting transcriptional regulator [Deltaproteobacteria bacterium]